MQIIIAGYSKTGTKSLNAALTQLGFRVYDILDNFWHFEEEWKKIYKEGATIDNFKKMYDDVDAVIDVPTYPFWEEMSKAFPEAKIILSIRDAETWAESMKKQIDENTLFSLIQILGYFLSSTGRRLVQFAAIYHPLCFAHTISLFNPSESNKTLLKKRFNEHNSYVIQNAPKTRLLIYNVKEGWKPLCDFLGEEIPDQPFPWLNKDGSFVKPMVRKHPVGKQIAKEIILSLIFLSVVFAILLYYMFY